MQHQTLILSTLILLNSFSFTCAISDGDSVESSAQFPFSVTLTNPILCGGSIISLDPPYILTAAHCIAEFNINDEISPSVLFGDKEYSQQSSAYIKRVVTHPMYMSIAQQKTQAYYMSDTIDITPYDIGLMELTKPLVASINVNRVQLYQHNLVEEKKNMTGTNSSTDTTSGTAIFEMIGMGYTGLNEPHASVLQYAECCLFNTAMLLSNNNFNNSIISATADAGLCHGDSGSPLLYKASDTSQYLLKGVLNRILNAYDPDPANTSCPLRQDINSDFVNLFVKTSSHIDWISEVTGLPKSAFMEPVKPSNNSHLFSTTISMSSRLQINAWKLLLPMLLLLSLLFPIM